MNPAFSDFRLQSSVWIYVNFMKYWVLSYFISLFLEVFSD